MPNDQQSRIDSMVFDAIQTTTCRTDYTGEPNKEHGRTAMPGRTFAKMKRPSGLNYLQTLEEWKDNKPAHFALFLKPKEITNTNPWDVQKEYSKLPDEHRDEAIRSRPRITLHPPAVSMDDIPGSKRKIIVDSIYKTSQMINEETIKQRHYSNVCSPLPDLPAPAEPIPRMVVRPPYVSPEWRMDSVQWDSRQIRTYCEPTKHFWLNRGST